MNRRLGLAANAQRGHSRYAVGVACLVVLTSGCGAARQDHAQRSAAATAAAVSGVPARSWPARMSKDGDALVTSAVVALRSTGTPFRSLRSLHPLAAIKASGGALVMLLVTDEEAVPHVVVMADNPGYGSLARQGWLKVGDQPGAQSPDGVIGVAFSWPTTSGLHPFLLALAHPLADSLTVTTTGGRKPMEQSYSLLNGVVFTPVDAHHAVAGALAQAYYMGHVTGRGHLLAGVLLGTAARPGHAINAATPAARH